MKIKKSKAGANTFRKKAWVTSLGKEENSGNEEKPAHGFSDCPGCQNPDHGCSLLRSQIASHFSSVSSLLACPIQIVLFSFHGDASFCCPCITRQY